MRKLTQEEFIERAKQKHGEIYDYSKVIYKNRRTKISIICPKHGVFLQTPGDHLTGYGCPICGGTKKLTTEEFIKKAKEIHGVKYDYSKVEYKNAKTPVTIICHKKNLLGKEHGEFRQVPNYHLSGNGCQKCGIEKSIASTLKSKEEFILKARQIHGWKYDYSKVEYLNNETKVCIICLEHGEFWQTPHSHLRGNGCPHCRESKLEREIAGFLNENKLMFKREKTFKWLRYNGNMFLDFYLSDYNIGIECQGIQHFEPVDRFGGEEGLKECLIRDKMKKELCAKNGIKIFYYVDPYIEYETNEIYEENNTTKNKEDIIKAIEYGKFIRNS